MINKEEIVLKSNNGNKYLTLVFLAIMVYAVIWSLFKDPVILFYSIPMLIVTSWTSRTTIVTEKSINFNYPYRIYNRRKKNPFSYIKSIGKIHGTKSFG